MRNFKGLALILISGLMLGCLNEDNGHFFDTALINTQSQQIEYQAVHQLNLTIKDMDNQVDEAGFSPKFKSQFQLVDTSKGPWPQAWVAFNIELSIKGSKLAEITRAGAMENHSLVVDIEQTLPRFGIKAGQIDINIKPIAWMPTFPLNIQATSNEHPQSVDENITSVNP